MNNKEIKERMDRSFNLGLAQMAGEIFLILSVMYTFFDIQIGNAEKIDISFLAITGMILIIITRVVYKKSIKELKDDDN